MKETDKEKVVLAVMKTAVQRLTELAKNAEDGDYITHIKDQDPYLPFWGHALKELGKGSVSVKESQGKTFATISFAAVTKGDEETFEDAFKKQIEKSGYDCDFFILRQQIEMEFLSEESSFGKIEAFDGIDWICTEKIPSSKTDLTHYMTRLFQAVSEKGQQLIDEALSEVEGTES